MISRAEIIIKLVILFIITHLQSCFLHLMQQPQIILITQLIFMAHQISFIRIFSPFPFPVFYWLLSIITISTRFIIIKTVNNRPIPFPVSRSILTNMPILLLPNVPSIRPHINKINPLTRIRHITPNRHRIQQTICNIDILKGYVAEGDPWLRGTGTLLVKWVQHATRAIAVGLFHLLGTDVDCPPQRTDHCEIGVVDVLDQTGSLVAWICLHVDTLESFHNVNIPERYIPDTITPPIGRHTANSHPNPKHNPRILNQHILRTVPPHIPLVTRLRHHNIIKILYRQIVDMHTGAARINSVSVEGEQGYETLQREFFQQGDLGSCVYQDGDVVELGVVTLVHFQVELGGIFHGDVMDLDVPRSLQSDQMRPIIIILQQLLIIEYTHNPPMVPPTINFPPTMNRQILTIVTTDEILVVARFRLCRPSPNILGRRQFPLDDDGHIVDIVHSHGEAIKCAFWNFYYTLLGLRGVCLQDCGCEGFGVYDVGAEVVLMGQSSEIGYYVDAVDEKWEAEQQENFDQGPCHYWAYVYNYRSQQFLIKNNIWHIDIKMMQSKQKKLNITKKDDQFFLFQQDEQITQGNPQ